MSKAFLITAIWLVVLAQAGFAQQKAAAIVSGTNNFLMLDGDKLWVEDRGWNVLKYNGVPIYLYLDECNPTFFALVYNTFKDIIINKDIICELWVKDSVHKGTYSISQIYIRR